jgi:hypothetical protein
MRHARQWPILVGDRRGLALTGDCRPGESSEGKVQQRTSVGHNARKRAIGPLNSRYREPLSSLDDARGRKKNVVAAGVSACKMLPIFSGQNGNPGLAVRTWRLFSGTTSENDRGEDPKEVYERLRKNPVEVRTTYLWFYFAQMEQGHTGFPD